MTVFTVFGYTYSLDTCHDVFIANFDSREAAEKWIAHKWHPDHYYIEENELFTKENAENA